MAATQLQANWTAVSHGAQTLIRIDSISFENNGQLTPYSGDDDVFDVVVANLHSTVTATVTSSDTATLMGIAQGTDATLSATHNDAIGATGGDILYVLTHAVASGASTSGSHAAFGTSSMQFMAYSPDGQTNPLSFTRA